MQSLTQLFGVLVGFAPFVLVAFIVWVKHQQKLMDHQRQVADSTVNASAEKAAQYATYNRELEERVRVLERIVTDRGYDVATQIEALRDTHRVENERQGS